MRFTDSKAARQMRAPALFLAFFQKKYGSSYQGGISCVTTFPPSAAGLQAAQSQKQRVEDMAKQDKAQIVETDWKYTP